MNKIKNYEFTEYFLSMFTNNPIMYQSNGAYLPLREALDIYIEEYNKMPYEKDCPYCNKRFKIKPIFDSKQKGE